MNVVENPNASQSDAQANRDERVEGEGQVSSVWCSCDALE